TGETHSIKEFLDIAFGQLDLDWQKYVRIDERYYRPAEVEILLGDYSKAKKILNWEPKIHFEQLVNMMIMEDHNLAKNEKLLKDHSV
ncbi:MAG: GDP-mannose 4,6-dehydratase, partial [Anaerohalosphaera sp.]|nr:GDP-mannose 4,6-dehydratase [Anaerohalosphaera sp.]